MARAKTLDIERASVVALFSTWYEHHHDRPMALSDLHPKVKALAVGDDGSRRVLEAVIAKRVNIRIAGMTLTRGNAGGHWASIDIG